MSTTHKMVSLQKKVSTTLVLGSALFIALSFFVLRGVVAPAFDELEISAADTDLIRAEQALLNDIANLDITTGDWALWDDMYNYVLGQNPNFYNSNLVIATLDKIDLDMLAIYKSGPTLDWSQLLVNGQEQSIDDLSILTPGTPEFEKLTSNANGIEGMAGIISTALGPMILSSRPILRSDDSGPVAGTLIMAQFLNPERLERLRERTEVHMSWLSVDEFAASLGQELAASNIQTSVTHSTGTTVISSSKMLTDMFGSDVLILTTDTPRDISALGSKTVNLGLYYFGAASLALTLVISFLLRGTILGPLERLTQHLTKIRKSGDLKADIDMGRNDEIGALSDQFDKLTSEVHEARKALLDQSFKAGKADTAAEVLHNIRNAMTPLINGIERLTKSCAVGETLRIAEVTKELADPVCPPERAAKLLQYVDASFKRMAEVRVSAADDLKLVSSQARQVEAIVSDQERFANVAPVAEDIPVDEVLSEAAHVIPKDDDKSVEIDIAGDLDGFSVHAHRVGLLQVMGNLILNAYESIQREKKNSGEISLSASADVLEEKPMIRVTIRDNGNGFCSEVGPKIFERGFTSKPDGKTNGLGLHWCANAVASMGGRILAESAGQGEGAEFHVLLPAAQGV
jgi:two-component system NtrC family sensor kinase